MHDATDADAGKAARKLFDAATKDFAGANSLYGRKLQPRPSGTAILALDRETWSEVFRLVIDQLDTLEQRLAISDYALTDWDRRHVQVAILRTLLSSELAMSEADVVRLLAWPVKAAELSANGRSSHIRSELYPLPELAATVENCVKSYGLGPDLRNCLDKFLKNLRSVAFDKICRKVAARLEAVLTGGTRIILEAGEAWSDVAIADLNDMKGSVRPTWDALLVHCQAGGRGKYSERWRQTIEPLIKTIGFDRFKKRLLVWFPLVDKPRTLPQAPVRHYYSDYTDLIVPGHVEVLRGLVGCCGLREDDELARALMRLALSAYRKIPGKGPRLVSLGNACVTALGMMPGMAPIGQLAILKVKVKFGTAQKEIAKAFNAAALREKLPVDEIEELAVPSYGLEEVGRLDTSFGEYRAELIIDGSSAGLHWLKGDKPVKSAPAAVRAEHPAEYKELQASLKDINAMLPAQRERIDALFLAQRSWPIATWRERYLDHPLIGAIARRLIWSFTAKGKTIDGIWHDGELVGLNAKPLNFKAEPTVSLWHPIGRAIDDVLAWRDWLERREVVQPFKQAHREIYLLTDAEIRTGTYSNRFAAHVLKQHQFNALCAARGWKNKLRLMVDDSYPPATRTLSAWGLRAEFWIEGAGDEHGRDTNDSGVFLYLATDQVRFYSVESPQLRAHASGGGYETIRGTPDEPLALDSIPPLVFSEIMRDVDLFVGVASVGNDPNWSDGGPGGRYRDYWSGYSFGELSATAQTRRALLERLLPRLRIAERCSLSERFLHVQGDIRGYKIHLGSGNILMTPNDQYLCIVPKQTTAGHDRVFLPFEGDSVLSVILSKAFLLAGDTKITDPSITSQLKR